MAAQRDKQRSILASLDWVTIVIYIALLPLDILQFERFPYALGDMQNRFTAFESHHIIPAVSRGEIGSRDT